jgi:hypothetical protein
VRSVALAFAVVVLTSACGQTPEAPPQATQEVDHAAEGKKALARQDWPAAASHFQQALVKLPADLGVHYGLAIATSWLDQKDEATREFRWVVENGPPASEEVRVAREWLAGRGGSGTVAATRTESTPAVVDERVGESGVAGTITWDDGRGLAPLKRFQVHLYALKPDGSSKGISFHVRTDFEGRYNFKKIPAGTYKMTDNNVTTPQWRLRVEVKEGETLPIDLTPGNSLRVRDDFPKSG